MSVDQEKRKEKVIHEEPHNELDELINFMLSSNPITKMQKVIHAIGRRLMELASTQPYTLEIQQREDKLMHLVETYTIAINVVLNYNKISIMVFIVYPFIYVFN